MVCDAAFGGDGRTDCMRFGGLRLRLYVHDSSFGSKSMFVPDGNGYYSMSSRENEWYQSLHFHD